MSGKAILKRPMMTTEQFIVKSSFVHGDKYNYTKSNYTGYQSKLEIICNKCNQSFWMQPNNHLSGQNCSHCFGKKRFTTEQFIEKSKDVHEDNFSYKDVLYVNNCTKVIITCNACLKTFRQTPSSHMDGAGCDYCDQIKSAKARTKTLDQFIIDAKKVHGDDAYDYSEVNYINSNVKVKIKCINCNITWEQLPSNHLSGKGCLQCCLKTSKGEISWLNYLNIDESFRQKTIWCDKLRYVVDAYVPETNTIYEYYGDFWHGNPKTKNLSKINKKSGLTFGELYDRTLKKEEVLKKFGYEIVSIWESDWI